MSGPASAEWDRYWVEIGNEQWLAARELLNLSPRVRNLFAAFLAVERNSGAARPEVELDWEAAADQAERDGLSSTEYRLARVVAALTTGRPVDLESLAWMGSWQGEVWRVLVQWGTDGAWTTSAADTLPTTKDDVRHPSARPEATQ